MAESFASFVHNHIFALKHVVEAEGLDCEFELRRSFDVFLDEGQAEYARTQYQAGVKAGHRWTKEVDFVGAEFAEQVSTSYMEPCSRYSAHLLVCR